MRQSIERAPARPQLRSMISAACRRSDGWTNSMPGPRLRRGQAAAERVGDQVQESPSRPQLATLSDASAPRWVSRRSAERPSDTMSRTDRQRM
jgi:hypothetical protein